MKYLMIGGAGFIGSNFVDKLIQEENNEIIVLDNLSTGFKENINHHLNNKRFEFINGDSRNFELLKEIISPDTDYVIHLAAIADVRLGLENTWRDIDNNVLGTYNILEAMRINNVKKIVFSSSATIYGDPRVFPTPEDHPLIQTSFYGASKACCEAIIEAFCEAHGMQSWIFRFVSLTGYRYSHGVVYDFMRKLKENPKELEILGDGTQRKSFLDVSDCIEAVLLALKNMKEKVNIFNVGNTNYCDITTVANWVCEEMALKNVKYKYTGGERGWIGDAPFVFLDVSKLLNLNWKPKYSNEETIRNTVKYMLKDNAVFSKDYYEAVRKNVP